MFDTYQHYFPATFYASQAELFYTWLRHLYVSINSINVTLLTCRRWCAFSKRKYIPGIFAAVIYTAEQVVNMEYEGHSKHIIHHDVPCLRLVLAIQLCYD